MTEPNSDGAPKEEETPPSGGAGEPEMSPGQVGQLDQLKAELDERVNDLKRVTAEYANYRKRVERDRKLVADQAVVSVVSGLLPVLDDLDRAREHGDLTGPFGSVAEQLVNALAKHGLTAFGEKGDAFDPNRHEAVAHMLSPEVTEPTCIDVMRRGYELGDRLVRAALVAVADPADPPAAKPAPSTEDDAKPEADEPDEAAKAPEKSDVDAEAPAGGAAADTVGAREESGDEADTAEGTTEAEAEAGSESAESTEDTADAGGDDERRNNK